MKGKGKRFQYPSKGFIGGGKGFGGKQPPKGKGRGFGGGGGKAPTVFNKNCWVCGKGATLKTTVGSWVRD